MLAESLCGVYVSLNVSASVCVCVLRSAFCMTKPARSSVCCLGIRLKGGVR